MNERLRRSKIQRLKAGHPARLIDLFAGCGGLSLGFWTAGQASSGQMGVQSRIEIAAGLEIDADAIKTHAFNFHGTQTGRFAIPRDITQIEPEPLMAEFTTTPPQEAIDLIVGGPPCQAFSRIGRAKLREIAANPEAHLYDDRTNLYLRYLHYVERLQPLALLMENVPEMMNHGGVNFAALTCEALEKLGYQCAYTLLNAVHYGVPQMRARMFLMAWVQELEQEISFPEPTCSHELPDGYSLAATGALKLVREQNCKWFMAPKNSADQAAVTAEQALSDLPKITWHLQSLRANGASSSRKRPPNALPVGQCLPYQSDPPNAFAHLMRNWPGLPSPHQSNWHVIRWLKRDYPIFARMQPGDQYPEAVQHALALFNEKLLEFQLPPEGDSEPWQTLRSQTVPPYDPGKFPNKWRKMEADQPARTLMAHLGKDSYSHIHYDSNQARTISVREAARLQSFPDAFEFSGGMNAALRQIGNAVPPLLAWHLGRQMLKSLGVV